MADGGQDLSMFHLYSRLPVELQLNIVQRAFDSTLPDSGNFAYSEFSCLDRVWQQVVESRTFDELAINVTDIANFGQFCVGPRRSFLKRLIFEVDVSSKSCPMNCNNDPEQQDQLSPLQAQESLTSKVTTTENLSLGSIKGATVTKQSASRMVTMAYSELFRLLATWSWVADHAQLDFVYVFKSTYHTGHIYLDQIKIDVESIPPVTVIKQISAPEYSLPYYTTEISWYTPSYLRLLTRMHGLENCEITNLVQTDRPSTMQASESKIIRSSCPTLPEFGEILGSFQVTIANAGYRGDARFDALARANAHANRRIGH